MKRSFTALLPAVSALIFSVTSSGSVQGDLTSLARDLRPSIVSVVSYDERKNVIARGTGFFTNTDQILTRRSVIAGAHHTEVRTDDDRVYKMVGKSDENLKADLARIVIEPPRTLKKPLVYKGSLPQVNERVFVLGSVGREQEFVEGIVAAVEETLLGKGVRINASLAPSLNGAPVFNTKGELVGMALFSNSGDSSFIAGLGESLTAMMPRFLNETAVDKKPRQLNGPQVSYTSQARRNGVEGAVYLRILIGEDGKVERANITKGLPDGLDDEALKAVYKLKFEPAIKDGVPVKYWMSIIIEFRLRER